MLRSDELKYVLVQTVDKFMALVTEDDLYAPKSRSINVQRSDTCVKLITRKLAYPHIILYRKWATPSADLSGNDSASGHFK